MSRFQKTTILSIALLLSLSANIGLASFMAGHRTAVMTSSSDSTPAAPRPTAGNAFAEVIRDAPQEQRQALRKIVAQRRPELRQAVQALQEQRRTVAEIVQNDPMDQAALTQALTDLRSRTTAAQEAGHQLLLDLVPHLTAEQRHDLIQRQRNLVR